MIKTTAITRQVIISCNQRTSNKSGNSYLQVHTRDMGYNTSDFLDWNCERQEMYAPGTTVDMTIMLSIGKTYSRVEIVDATPVIVGG